MDLIARLFFILHDVVWFASIAVALLLFVRVILRWVDVNPYGRIPYHLTRLTEPLVRPLRAQFFGVRMRFDLIPLLMGVMILFVGWFIASMLSQLGWICLSIHDNLRGGPPPLRFILSIGITLVGLLYLIAIFLRFFLPLIGVGYRNNFFRFLFVITEPLLKPLRRFFVMGMFDFSPFIAMLIVQILTPILARAVLG